MLTVNLLGSGYVAEPGEVFIKDWSEHSGLAAALVAARVAKHVESLRVGPHGATAHRLRIIDEVHAVEDRSEYPATGSDREFEDQLAAVFMRLTCRDQH